MTRRTKLSSLQKILMGKGLMHTTKNRADEQAKAARARKGKRGFRPARTQEGTK